MRRLLASPWTWAVVAAAVRFAALALGPGLSVAPYSDSVDYHRLAAHLASGAGFALGPDGALFPSTFRPPLLPFVIAPFYALFGAHYLVALLVQIALGALLVPAVHALAREVAGPATGTGASARAHVPLAAAIATALWPPLIYFSITLLTETLTALLQVVAVILAVRLLTRGGAALALGLGVALGLAALARPTALPLAAALFAWLLLAPRRPARARAIAVGLALLALGFAIGPWIVRNHAVTGRWIGLTSGGGAALYDSNNPIVLTDPRWRGGALSLRQVDPYAGEFRGLDEVEIDRLSAKKAREFLAAHRDRWLEMAGWKLARFFRPFSETPVTGDPAGRGSTLGRIVRAFDPLFFTYGILLPFFAGALLWALARPRSALFAPALAVLVQAALAAVYWGSLRMRAPVEPFIVVLGMFGLAAVVTALARLVRPASAGARPNQRPTG
ncbi:MAG: glycosyltransferase family 39 protein [Candidatus Eiseniibacteriota bacterium]